MNNGPQDDSQAFASADSGIGTALTQLLMAAEIQPGSGPSYQLCKTIFSYHPLGAVLTDAPVTRAQAKPREISIPMLGEERLVDRYVSTWDSLGQFGGTAILHNLMSTSRIYGIASLAVGEVGKDTSTPLDMNKIATADLFFNILDPLNTAGSLVLDLDPNSPGFLKPRGQVSVQGKVWHPSRLFVKMHEQPLYIDWTSSAYGFVGRSVYQRVLYPLKSYIQAMITNQMVIQKAGLVVFKAKAPGSFVDNIMQSFWGVKRAAVKAGSTGQVLSIGIEENIETLNMQNLDKAFNEARTNVIKDIASGAGMPASIIAQETLTEGFGEGTEDANKEIDFLGQLRQDMNPAYAFLDAICRRKAFTPDYYETLRGDYSEFGEGGHERMLHDAIRNFKASWPNLKSEPDSEKVKTEDVQLKAVIALLETLLPTAPPDVKAKLFIWAAENVNDREHLFAGNLDLDEQEIRDYFETSEAEAKEAMEAPDPKESHEPRPFSALA